MPMLSPRRSAPLAACAGSCGFDVDRTTQAVDVRVPDRHPDTAVTSLIPARMMTRFCI
jgi:hypothetical protein